MNDENKKGLRWKIFKLFGPHEVQNLIDHIDNLTQNGSDIVIIPTGEFEFHVKTSNQENIKPLVFSTLLERTAFQNGMNYGIGMLGGSTSVLSKDEYDVLDSMDKKSTHGGGNGTLN